MNSKDYSPNRIRANPPNAAHVVASVYWLSGARVSRNYGSTGGTGFWASNSNWENWMLPRAAVLNLMLVWVWYRIASC